MLSGTLLNYIAYFEEWAEANPDVAYFQYGGIEKGIVSARSNPAFDYPFVWLEEPSIETSDNGASHLCEVYSSGISVLIYAAADDWAAQKIAQDKALQILYSLQKQLRADNRAGKLVCELNGMKKEPISQLWVDSHFGWRLQFECMFNLNIFLGTPAR